MTRSLPLLGPDDYSNVLIYTSKMIPYILKKFNTLTPGAEFTQSTTLYKTQ